jgi:BirA family biotin operon repressor/biotin-[acetyl-CoA-carboxylase] ligase
MSSSPHLDLAVITRALGAAACRFDIDILAACDSTNRLLLARAEAGAPSGAVVVAEQQTAGRGRRGRNWISAAGDSLTFSLLWRFVPGTSPAGLSLAVGVAVAQAVEKAGSDEATGEAPAQQEGAGQNPARFAVDALQGGQAKNALMKPLRSRAVEQSTLSSPLRILAVADGAAANSGIQLKWPNDILLRHGKLGGILVELVPGLPHGAVAAVIGVGINRRLPAALPEDVLAAALDQDVDVNVLLAAVLTELLHVLEDFAGVGFAAQREAWLARHAFEDQPVVLLSGFAPPSYGICRGVAADGALLLESEGRIERILSGEISLRPAP